MVHLRGMEVLLWVLDQLLKSGHSMLALPCQYADVGRETLSQLVLPSQSVALWEVLYHWHHGP